MVSLRKGLLLIATISYFFVNVCNAAEDVDLYCGAKNCYETLSLPNFAEKKDVKKAFRTLSIRYHPDKTSAEEDKEIFLVSSLIQSVALLSLYS